MYGDPMVAEIRQLRDEYAWQCDDDLDAIRRDLRAQQERSGRHVVRRQPKRPGAQPTFAQPRVTEQTDAAEPK